MSQQPSITPEDQYKEVAEWRRQADRFVWQIPTVVVTVAGALLVSNFAFVKSWLAREFILGVAAVFTGVLTYALMAHRHWGDVSRKTLAALEQEQATKSVHWGGKAEKDKTYWYSEEEAPKWYGPSAYRVFLGGMVSLVIVLLVLMVLNLPVYNWDFFSSRP